MGLPGIPGFSVFGFQLSGIWSYLLLVLVFVIVTVFVIKRIVNSPSFSLSSEWEYISPLNEIILPIFLSSNSNSSDIRCDNTEYPVFEKTAIQTGSSTCKSGALIGFFP